MTSGIAYHHVADNYILLFSTFMSCGGWEAVEIKETTQYIFNTLGLKESLLEEKQEELKVAIQNSFCHNRGYTKANDTVITLILENEDIARMFLSDLGRILGLTENTLHLPGEIKSEECVPRATLSSSSIVMKKEESIADNTQIKRGFLIGKRFGV